MAALLISDTNVPTNGAFNTFSNYGTQLSTSTRRCIGVEGTPVIQESKLSLRSTIPPSSVVYLSIICFPIAMKLLLSMRCS